MKTTPVLALAMALALSMQACTVSPNIRVMPSSDRDATPSFTIKRPLYKPELDGPPPVYRANTLADSVETEGDTTIPDASVGGSVDRTEMMREKAVTIIGEIVVACVTSGNCW